MPAKEIRAARACLREAIEMARGRATGDAEAVERTLARPVVRLARELARNRFRHLPPNVDRGLVESRAVECAWLAIRRVDLSRDTAQIIRFFGQKASSGANDAARAEDLLPRRARSLRRELLAHAALADPGAGPKALERMARQMFPIANRMTVDLVVHGAPAMLDAADDDVSELLAHEVPDPSEDALRRAVTDAVHVAVADQTDPVARAWAAAVLCGERAVIRVPKAVAPSVPGMQHVLADVR